MIGKLKAGFTLIELLVVVAIVAILSAIAVPNFLQAQVRSKVARAKSDIRQISAAIQAYIVDENAYPPSDTFLASVDLIALSTPVAYMSSVAIADPFGTQSADVPSGKSVNLARGYAYVTYEASAPLYKVFPAT